MIKGADIGWLSMLEKLGISYVDENMNQSDPLDLLKGFGINTIRLRLFVDPPGSCFWRKNNGQRVMLGFCDRKGVRDAAKRARDKGFKLMIDFHYSDHFADPEYQDIPKLWAAADDVWAVALIQEHTERFLEALRDDGVEPDFVQVGNEINNGMLFPLGSYPDEKRSLAKFLTAGYDAVKKVFPKARVITHLAEGNDRKQFEKFFDDVLIHYKAKTDIIGMSYYPYWLGKGYKETINDLSLNLMKCAKKYDKDVMICEIGGLETEPEDLVSRIKFLRSNGFNGFNVTIPLKVPVTLFLSECDNISNTLVIIKSAGNRRFGGFASEIWESPTSAKFKDDKNSFLFSLDKQKIYSYRNNGNALRCFQNYGPCFGGGCDIGVLAHPIQEKLLYTFETYENSSYNFFGDKNALSESGSGSSNCICASEIEVFQVVLES